MHIIFILEIPCAAFMQSIPIQEFVASVQNLLHEEALNSLAFTRY